ncbi:MAG: caspase family protein [Bacteroidales bacterium]|nr:caspase family protein [Bacteroidales bacterium]
MKKQIIITFIVLLFCNLSYSQIDYSFKENKTVTKELKKKYHKVEFQKNYARAGKYSYSIGVKYYKVRNKLSKYGICDKDGRELCPPKYDDVFWDGGNYILIKENKKYGLISTNGDMILPPSIESKRAYYLSEDTNVVIYTCYTEYFMVKISYYDFYNRHGVCILTDFREVEDSPKTAFFASINDGLIKIKKDGKWGCIDTEGNVVIKFEYDGITQDNGKIKLKKDGFYQTIDNPLKRPNSNDENIAVNNSTIDSNNNNPNNNNIISSISQNNQRKRQQLLSDVDKQIPFVNKVNDNIFAFIIANEDYPQKKVPYALNDGRIFKEYCIKTLGINEKRVNLYENATGNNIVACVEKIKQVAKAYGGDANIIFYYAGHAFPDEQRSTGYLLPIDGDSKITATGYALDKLYKELSSVKIKSIVCFIDACFSGATREDEILLTGRGVAIKVKEEVPKGNVVVFTSASGDETAHQYEEQGHGMFTYFLLKKLKETKGDVTLGVLSDYVIEQVQRTSVTENDKLQTPTVIPSISLSQSWKNLKLIK